MKLVTFAVDTPLGEVRRVGGLADAGRTVVDLTAARELQLVDRGDGSSWARAREECPSDMLGFIGGGERTLAAAAEALDFAAQLSAPEGRLGMRAVYDLAEVRLLSPLPRPNSIRCFSLSEKHMLAGIASMQDTAQWGGTAPSLTALPPEWYNLPTYYKTSTAEVYGPDDVVPWPALTGLFDYELEVAVIIGRRGRGIAAADAAPYIFGYTLYNDWSARDFQNREMSVNLGPGLCKDNASSLGPCIVTADDIDLQAAEFTVTVDGEQWARTQVDFHFPLERLIEYVSEVQTIFPGDVFTTGTLPGGSGAEKKKWISEGSTVVLAADGIGSLSNQVGRRGEPVPLPAAQRPWTEAIRGSDT